MSFVKDTVNAFTGKTGADASLEGARIQSDAIQQGINQQQGIIDQYQPIIQQGISNAGFLTDPQAQFDFLKSNPLFQMSIDNANTQTNKMAAASGRLSAGDTLQQLSNNVLLSASPLISQQSRNIQNLLTTGGNISTGTTSNITDLTTTGGATQAAGLTGAANARAQGASNILDAALLAGGIGGK